MTKEKAHLLIAIKPNDNEHWDFDDRLNEILNLCRSASVEVVGITAQKQKSPQRTYLGSGKLSEAKNQISTDRSKIIIVDDAISPNQQRFLEDFFKIKVIDRAALILDIFAARARTREGRLQVGLAQAEYLLPRLAGQWSHLERLGGGVGTRGPGETQIETDRRLVRNRIRKIKKDLLKVKKSRNAQRSRRISQAYNISLVGYTNAGKSTLFNQLSKKQVISSSRLFSTLDTTTGQIYLGPNKSCTISDTVGFVNKLPTVLIDSFKATLEELHDSDLLIHVIDASNPNYMKQVDVVDSLLEDLKLESKNILYVLNKLDELSNSENKQVEESMEYLRKIDEQMFIGVSALTGKNMENLFNLIQKHYNKRYNETEVLI